MPKSRPEERQKIVEQLISGYRSHDYSITRSEVYTLGLAAADATPQEEILMWQILKACRSGLDLKNSDKERVEVGSVMFSRNFTARYIRRWDDFMAPSKAGLVSPNTSSMQNIRTGEARWEIL